MGIHFVLFHAILGKQQGSWKNKFFSTIPSNELIFYRIDPLGFIGIRLPVLRKSVCCVFVCVIGSILKQVLISGTFFYLIHFGKITLLPTILLLVLEKWNTYGTKVFTVHHTYVWLGLSLLVTALCSTAEWWCIFHFAKQDYYDPRREWLFFPSFVTEKSPPLHFGSD